jgi:hypothetical protein
MIKRICEDHAKPSIKTTSKVNTHKKRHRQQDAHQLKQSSIATRANYEVKRKFLSRTSAKIDDPIRL